MALIPDFLIPYKRTSRIFIVALVVAIIKGLQDKCNPKTISVRNVIDHLLWGLADHFLLSESTVYGYLNFFLTLLIASDMKFNGLGLGAFCSLGSCTEVAIYTIAFSNGTCSIGSPCRSPPVTINDQNP